MERGRWYDDGERHFENFSQAARYWERKAGILLLKIVGLFVAFAAFMAVGYLVLNALPG